MSADYRPGLCARGLLHYKAFLPDWIVPTTTAPSAYSVALVVSPIEALKIRQEIGDRAGEEATWHQLGSLAAGHFSRKEESLRLLFLSHWILTDIGAARSKATESWINTLATQLEYDEETFNQQFQATLASYQKDRGQSLLREAFPDAAFPEEEPRAENGDEGESETNAPGDQ